MIIKELELTNIRSHGHSQVRFPAGRTLLEGDIGSGKSSVLMAIEFSLFGLGSDSGSSILRLGQDNGEVRMVFDVDGSEYEITRKLQRKPGRVQQLEGELKTPEGTLDLSPSELKEKVLEILEFNEAPDPKAQSWIYRYAVYTPQEEMKNILALVPDQRLQILRRAFGVEDYKVAATNAEDAARQVREDAREQEGIAKGVDALRNQLQQLHSEEERHGAELSRLEGAEAEAEGQVRSVRANREMLQKREFSLQSVKTEQELFERQRSDSARDAEELLDEITELKGELSKVEESMGSAEDERVHSTPPISELKKKERSLEAKSKKLRDLKVAAETKLSDYESIMKNGVCPICDRPAKPREYKNKKEGKDAERKHFSDELASVEEEIEEVRGKLELAEEERERHNELILFRKDRLRLKGEIGKKDVKRQKFAERESQAEKNLGRLKEQLGEIRELAAEIEKVDADLSDSEIRLRKVRDALVGTRGLIESIRNRRNELTAEIAAKEEAANTGRKLKETEIWLEDYFVPTVKVIEKSVLATINQEFDSLFKRWFGMLVADADKEVGIDEDFTPAVTQGGYEQDVKYLSGGERTSVALAYRLALNVLAQRVSAGMKSNLLILDEPTDGFSREQLGNVREVLDEIACPQVIIVSHDKELESFADQIFRVEKVGSESAVSLRGL